MARPHPETISPTAHYTGYVWFAHGHSHEAFATTTGRMILGQRLPDIDALTRLGQAAIRVARRAARRARRSSRR